MLKFEEFKELVEGNNELKSQYKEKIIMNLTKHNVQKTENDINQLIDACLSSSKFVDEDFARWCNKHNMQWADSNFYVGSDVTSLSSCCRLINDFSKLDVKKTKKDKLIEACILELYDQEKNGEGNE